MAYIPSQEDLLGMPTIGRSVTATLFVSPNGNNSVGAALKKDKAGGSGDATDFIFNVGTRISADGLSSEGAGDTCAIWLEIQEI